MAEFFHQFELQILALSGALLAATIRYLFRPRSRLVYSSPHSFTFLLHPDSTQPQFLVHTASIWIRNAGREPATEVELTFNYKPQNYNVSPARPFDPFDSPDGRHTLKFSNIAPKEFLQIEMITNQPLPSIVSFRSKEGVGKLIKMRPYQVLPNYILALLWVFIFIGVATTIYLVLVLIAPYIPYFRKD